MTRRRPTPKRDNPRTIHPCPIPDHADLGIHYHEVQPGMWRLHEVPK